MTAFPPDNSGQERVQPPPPPLDVPGLLLLTEQLSAFVLANASDYEGACELLEKIADEVESQIRGREVERTGNRVWPFERGGGA